MVDDNELERLRDIAVPAPGGKAKARAFAAAVSAFDMEQNISTATQGTAAGLRLTERARKLWREIMQRKLIATPAITALVALPIAGYTAFQMLKEQPPVISNGRVTETLADKPAAQKPAIDQPAINEPPAAATARQKKTDADSEDRLKDEAQVAPAAPPKPATEVDSLVKQQMEPEAMPAPQPAPAESGQLAAGGSANAQAPAMRSAQMPAGAVADSKLMVQPSPIPADQMQPQEENRDRIETFKT